VETGELIRTLEGHIWDVNSVSFSPDGGLLASGSWDKTIRLWEVETGKCIRTLSGHTDWVHSVAFFPDGKLLASGSRAEIKLWDVRTGRCIRTLKDHTSGTLSIAFFSDGKLLASGSLDHTVKLWDVRTGECIRTLEGHKGDVNSVAFSPDGRYLASGSEDKTVRLWDVRTGECVRTLEGHTGNVTSVAFSPDGGLLASGADDRTVRLWDVETGKCISTLEGHTSYVKSVAFSPDGRLLASGSWDKMVKLWDTEAKKLFHTFKGHNSAVRSITFSPDRRLLASGSADGTVLLWDVASIPAPPQIVSLEFPGSVWTGGEAKGTISFHDPDGDIAQARFEVLEGQLEGFTLDLTRAPYAESVRGKPCGSFAFTLKVDQLGGYRIRVVLVDAAGLESEPYESSFRARTPTAPRILRVVFPRGIAIGEERNGLVKFEDPEGDIVSAEFEILEGDPASIEVKPALEFDPGVRGRTRGSFRFSVVVHKAQTVTLRLTLLDATGLRSEPYEFTFQVE